MAFEDEADDERPPATPPLPPEDRLWRHPSEVASGMAVPAAWGPPTSAEPRRRSVALAALAGAGLTGAVLAVGVMWFTRPTRVVVHEAAPTAAKAMTTAVFAPAGVPSEALAKRMAPSLVHIEASHGDDWTSGTGIRLDRDGTIAVATPVVSGAGAVMVTVGTGDRVRAKTGASDPATGITIITVTGDQGTVVTADPVKAEAGQPVAVIGAASAAADGSTTQRVVTASVSATGIRTTVDPVVLHDSVQLDRAVPGDSVGGVVVDADGDLVGIVLAGSGSEDLAVVIPAGEALEAAKGLRDDGQVRRAWLGVRAIDLAPTAAELLSVKGGALLTKVDAGSPADTAGLEKGDVVTSVDGDPVGDASDLVLALRAWQPGEKVTIEWHRGTTADEAEITLGG